MIILKIKQNGSLQEIEDNKIDKLNDIPILHFWKENNIQLLGDNIEKNCNENKYDLPPPIDAELFFGELYVVKVDNNNNIIEFTLKDFENFYNLKFKGFYDINYTDNEEEDELSEHTSDRDFIDDNIENNTENDYEDSEDILDNDYDEEEDEEISFSISDNDDNDNDDDDDDNINIIDDINENTDIDINIDINIDSDSN